MTILRRLGPDPHANGAKTIALNNCPDILELDTGDFAIIGISALDADGDLLDTPAHFEEALLTGESEPVERLPGAMAYAGTICRDRPARVRVTRTGADTRLSELARLVEQAQAHRPRLAQVADRIASVFVVAMLAVAVATYLGWRIHEPARALEVTLSVLAIWVLGGREAPVAAPDNIKGIRA